MGMLGRDVTQDSREAMNSEKTEILKRHALSYELNFFKRCK